MDTFSSRDKIPTLSMSQAFLMRLDAIAGVRLANKFWKDVFATSKNPILKGVRYVDLDVKFTRSNSKANSPIIPIGYDRYKDTRDRYSVNFSPQEFYRYLSPNMQDIDRAAFIYFIMFHESVHHVDNLISEGNNSQLHLFSHEDSADYISGVMLAHFKKMLTGKDLKIILRALGGTKKSLKGAELNEARKSISSRLWSEHAPDHTRMSLIAEGYRTQDLDAGLALTNDSVIGYE